MHREPDVRLAGLGPQLGAALVVAVLKLGAIAALVAAPAIAVADDKSTSTSERGTTSAPISADEAEPKLSLPTEADRVAWQTTGFRLGLAVAYGEFARLRGAPSGRLLGAVLHAGLRL